MSPQCGDPIVTLDKTNTTIDQSKYAEKSDQTAALGLNGCIYDN